MSFSTIDLISAGALAAAAFLSVFVQYVRNDIFRNVAQAQADACRAQTIIHRILHCDHLDDNLFTDVMPFIESFGDESRCWDAVSLYEFAAELLIAKACIDRGIAVIPCDYLEKQGA